METKKEVDEFLDGLDESFKEIGNLFDNCETSKYLKKYNIQHYDKGYSLSLKKFISLIWNLKKDATDQLQIEFSFEQKNSFGRKYIRYNLALQGTFSEVIFIQIPYDKSNFKDGSLFTLLNIHIEVNGMDFEMATQHRELVNQCYFDFVTDYKR
jgi:hypothetical protein